MFEMKLQKEYYEKMLFGTKNIELRLFDSKRENIKIGDKIKFLNISCEESFDTTVTALLHYSSFRELMDDFDISYLDDVTSTKEELLNKLREIYSEADETKYGVLGIKIKRV
ncbi:MAG: hypothetical protein RSD09_04275 [Bacilli bacterium]